MKKKAKRVLIIEDEKPMARALELKLAHEGFAALSASDGVAALALLEKEVFDLIICDLVMPKMDGFEVLEALQTKKTKTPVIVLTNLSQAEDRKKVQALGAKDFFIKSDTPIATIIERVKTLLT